MRKLYPYHGDLRASLHTLEPDQLSIMASASLAISTAFAYALPLSAGAVEAIQLRANRRLCGDVHARRDLVPFDSQRCYIKLNFATFLGRRYISFGSSRCNEFLLPPAKDVAAHQFFLHFELHTATLLLTDTSQYGTWLSNDFTPKRSLHRATYPLVQSNDIGFGNGQRYRFRIVVADSAIDPIIFPDLFQRYVQSIGRKHPRLIHKLTAALSNVNDSFINLHKVGLGKYENVNTCLRLSDGVLFAAKKLFCEPVGEEDPRRAVGHRSVIKEAQFLRDARHVCFCILCDSITPELTKHIAEYRTLGRPTSHIAWARLYLGIHSYQPSGRYGRIVPQGPGGDFGPGSAETVSTGSPTPPRARDPS